MLFSNRTLRRLALCYLLLLGTVAGSAVRAEEPESMGELVVTEIESLRGRLPPTNQTNLSRSERGEWSEYSSQLQQLANHIRGMNDTGSLEGLLDRLEKAAEVYIEAAATLGDRQSRQIEQLQAIRDRALDDPEDYSDRTLLNNWFESLGSVESVNDKLGANKTVLQLVTVYAGYQVRSEPTYRSEFLLRYLDLLFPSVAAEFLTHGKTDPVEGRIYQRIITLTHRQIQTIKSNHSVRRNYSSMLRYHGGILQSIARSGPGSNRLSGTISDIERIGRSLTGVGEKGETYQFLSE